MASILENLGSGLEGAGAILSPDVANRQAIERQQVLPNMLRGLQIANAKRAYDADTEFSKSIAGMQPSSFKNSDDVLSAISKVPLSVIADSPQAQNTLRLAGQMQQREALAMQRREMLDLARDRIDVERARLDAALGKDKDKPPAMRTRIDGMKEIQEERDPTSPTGWRKIGEGPRSPAAVVNVEGGGKPPVGYRWSKDKPGTLEAIPGGPAAAGNVTDEAAIFAIKQAFAGDKSALQGLARNKDAKAKIMNLIPVVAKEQGLGPRDVALAQAEYQGMVQGERTLGQRQAQIEMAGSVLKQFIPIAVSASDAYKRSGIKSINDLQNAVAAGTASPELRRLNGAVNAVINAYGRAINPTGVASDSDKAEARKILDAGFSSGDFRAAANQIMTEINAELKAPGQVKQGMGEFFKGGNETPKEAPKKLTYDPTTGTFK